MGKLDGKIALVTGGNSGIGLATAKQFVQEGAYVFITGRRKRELSAAIKEIGRNVTGVQGDMSKLADLDRLFAQIKQEKGRLDIVFANAGIAKYAPFGAITEELYDAIFDVNVKGVLFTVQKALALMPNGASIILNASIVASQRAVVEQRLQRHQSRGAVVRADMDDGLEGPPDPGERGEPGLDRHPRAERAARLLGNRPATPQDDLQRRSARPLRHPRGNR
jgi:NAD(P)-dependent dehydrogenase (short-subunit alcohol dehydrogenase family)